MRITALSGQQHKIRGGVAGVVCWYQEGMDGTGLAEGAAYFSCAGLLGDGCCGGSSSVRFPARRSLCGGITVVVAVSGVLCTRVCKEVRPS